MSLSKKLALATSLAITTLDATRYTTAAVAQTVVTKHAARIGGRSIDYVATAGTLLLPNARHATATMFYVAYVAQGLGKARRRPITFAYNGGPGSSSALFDVGGFGPRIVVPDNTKHTPARAKIVDNENSILDRTDLVFVDAVGTGFSRLVNGANGKEYYGIDQDASAFSRFIRRYLDANDRGQSPKYLLGTSYGTTRSAVLVKMLEDRGIEIAGITLMSTVLDFSKVAGSDDDRYWLYVPTETAIAAYYKKIASSPKQLHHLLDGARAFAKGPYERALLEGDALSEGDTASIARQLHAFIGLPTNEIERLHIRVPPDRFRKALLSGTSGTIGRKGVDAASDPSLNAALSTFTVAFDRYVREELRFQSHDDYVFLSTEVNERWDWSRGGSSPLGVDVSADLTDAMTANPSLRILSVNGIYDLTTPFFATEYQLRHLGLAPSLRDHISFRYYPAGHLMVLDPIVRLDLKNDLEDFYSVREPVARSAARAEKALSNRSR